MKAGAILILFENFGKIFNESAKELFRLFSNKSIGKFSQKRIANLKLN